MISQVSSLTTCCQAILVVALFLLLFAIIMGYAMTYDYRAQLGDRSNPSHNFRNFFKFGSHYICLFFGFAFAMLAALVVYIMAIN